MKEIPSPKYSLQNEILEINKKVTETIGSQQKVIWPGIVITTS